MIDSYFENFINYSKIIANQFGLIMLLFVNVVLINIQNQTEITNTNNGEFITFLNSFKLENDFITIYNYILIIFLFIFSFFYISREIRELNKKAMFGLNDEYYMFDDTILCCYKRKFPEVIQIHNRQHLLDNLAEAQNNANILNDKIKGNRDNLLITVFTLLCYFNINSVLYLLYQIKYGIYFTTVISILTKIVSFAHIMHKLIDYLNKQSTKTWPKLFRTKVDRIIQEQEEQHQLNLQIANVF